MMDGDTSVLSLRIPGEELTEVFHNPALVGNQEEFCAPPKPPSEQDLEGYSCSAGHSFCYISPYGDVSPACSFPCQPAIFVSRNSWISGIIRRR